METLGVKERRYKKALSYNKEKDDEKLGQSNKKLERIERSGPR